MRQTLLVALHIIEGNYIKHEKVFKIESRSDDAPMMFSFAALSTKQKDTSSGWVDPDLFVSSRLRQGVPLGN